MKSRIIRNHEEAISFLRETGRGFDARVLVIAYAQRKTCPYWVALVLNEPVKEVEKSFNRLRKAWFMRPKNIKAITVEFDTMVPHFSSGPREPRTYEFVGEF